MPSTLDSLDTPFVTVDLNLVKQNLRSMHDAAHQRGLKVRPHTKTHRQPFFAHQQSQLGADGLTVAKLDEAEVMLEGGLNELLIAYPIVGESKAYRLAALMMRGLQPTVSIDSMASMQTLVLAATLSNKTIDVLVEVDTGFRRCGLTGSAVIELADAINKADGLQLRGLMSFAGQISGNTNAKVIRKIVEEDDQQLGHYASEFRAHGLPIDIISVGGTILSHHLDVLRHATEIRPGIYIFNDMGIVTSGAVSTSNCAARIWATVASRPTEDRAVLDAGTKILSTDGPLGGCFGHIIDVPGWSITRLSEEHAVVERMDKGAVFPEIGQRVSIIPNHICTVINLQNSVVGIEDERVVATLPVLARGGSH